MNLDKTKVADTEKKQVRERNESLKSTHLVSKEERNWAMFCHLSAFAGWFIPFANILGPLLIWLMKRETYPMVNEHGKESLNFQISMTIYSLFSILLIFIFIGIFIEFALLAAWFVFIIIASIKAFEGKNYKYPMTIRLIK